MTHLNKVIRQVLSDRAKLPVPIDTITETTNLFDSGMTSHSTVAVMLELEEIFDFEFPDAALQRSTFESIAAMRQALSQAGVSLPS